MSASIEEALARGITAKAKLNGMPPWVQRLAIELWELRKRGNALASALRPDSAISASATRVQLTLMRHQHMLMIQLANVLRDRLREAGLTADEIGVLTSWDDSTLTAEPLTTPEATMTTETAIEQQIQQRGLTAPRVTPQHVDDAIVAQQFYVFPGTTVTVCCLTLRNGFTVTGESACASPENFDAQIGEDIARENARQKIWPLLGFALRQRLHEERA